MKHGLKQEIRRGLSILLAASMVAGSALPVMAEEVVDETVEVEVVSDEVVDEAGDVVVDFTAEDTVVEDVLDGETFEVITEDAAEDYAYFDHKDLTNANIQKIVMWKLDDDGDLDFPMKVKGKCVAPDCKGEDIDISETIDEKNNLVTVAPTSETAGTVFSSGKNFVYTYTVTQQKDKCKTPEKGTYTVYSYHKDAAGKNVVDTLLTQNVTKAAEHTFTTTSNRGVVTPKTCSYHGTFKLQCEDCGEWVTYPVDTTARSVYKDYVESDTYLNNKVFATGHVYTATSKDVEWNADYTKATVKMTCKVCGDVQTVDVTDFIDVAANKAVANLPSCVKNVTATYKFLDDKGMSDVLNLILKNEHKVYPVYDAFSTLDTDLSSKKLDALGQTKVVIEPKVPTVTAGNDAVKFECTSVDDDGTPVIKATIVRCDTCKKNDANHVFTSSENENYKQLGYSVKVDVIKGETKKALSCGEGSTTEYTAALVLNGKTYASAGYTCTIKSGVKKVDVDKKGTWTVENAVVGSGHSFSGKVSNDTVYKGDTKKYKYKEATCVEEGYGYFYCTDCNNYIYSKIPVVAHKYVNKVLNGTPDCTTPAYYTADCKVCEVKGIKIDTANKANTSEKQSYSQSVAWLLKEATGYGQDPKLDAEVKAYNKELAEVYKNLQKEAEAELVVPALGHNYKVVAKDTLWASDYKSAEVWFKCANNGCTAGKVAGKVKNIKFVTTKEAGYDTKGEGYYTADAVYEEKDASGKVVKTWTEEIKSGNVEIPATGKQETATVSITDKTVTYNGNAQHVAATTNSDVKPVVSYYKDAACTTKFSSAPHTAGTYYVKATVAASEKFTAAESKVVKLVINKANPTVKVTPATKTVKNTKKNTVRIKVTQNNINSQTGKVTYKAASSKIKVNSNGVVTVKKGTKKGTYKVTVTVKATTNYNKVTKTVKIKVK